jgi:hypothetical protein
MDGYLAGQMERQTHTYIHTYIHTHTSIIMEAVRTSETSVYFSETTPSSFLF